MRTNRISPKFRRVMLAQVSLNSNINPLRPEDGLAAL